MLNDGVVKNAQIIKICINIKQLSNIYFKLMDLGVNYSADKILLKLLINILNVIKLILNYLHSN